MRVLSQCLMHTGHMHLSRAWARWGDVVGCQCHGERVLEKRLRQMARSMCGSAWKRWWAAVEVFHFQHTGCR